MTARVSHTTIGNDWKLKGTGERGHSVEGGEKLFPPRERNSIQERTTQANRDKIHGGG